VNEPRRCAPDRGGELSHTLPLPDMLPCPAPAQALSSPFPTFPRALPASPSTSPSPLGGFWRLRHHIRGTEAGFSDLSTPSWCWELETRAEGSGHLPQLLTFRAVPPFPPTRNQTLSPYLCLRGSFPALFSSSSNLLRASSSWVRGLGAGLGGMVGSWMKG